MAMKEQSRKGKGRREIARDKQRKAENAEQEAAARRKKKKRERKQSSSRLMNKRRLKAQNSRENSSGNKSGNCRRHPLKDLIMQSKGWKDRNYPEACFRVDGSKHMRTARQWTEHRRS